jgi:hypothetical protein
MIEFITQNFVPLMFGGLLAFLLTGIPVAFGLAATGLVFGFLGMEVGLFGSTMFQALPLRIFGRAVYDKPEFVSRQPLAAFFAAPRPPDPQAYRAYRAYLLETSQLPAASMRRARVACCSPGSWA